MKSLGENAFRLDSGTAGANAYLISTGAGLALIDPGFRSNLNRIARDLVHHGLSPYAVTDILLTHYDVDHATSAAEWVRRTGARLWIGRRDAEILWRRAPVPRTPFRRFMAVLGLPELPSSAHLIDGEAELPGGIRAIPTPGHTPGHTSFVHASIGFLGDSAMVAADGTLNPPPRFLDADPAQADHTRRVIAGLGLRVLCAGHTPPVALR